MSILVKHLPKALALLGLLHAIFPIIQPPLQNSVCPAGYSPGLLSWSAQSIALRQQNFTFAITKPTRLVKSGLYASMQHPSYTGGIAMIIGFCGLVMRTGGVLTCWSPNPVLDLAGKALIYGNNVYNALSIIWLIPRRFPQEEGLLRKALIPWIL
ncbi:hypothetical protein BDW68DRAFT_186896 [Aspergillus falconensis]